MRTVRFGDVASRLNIHVDQKNKKLEHKNIKIVVDSTGDLLLKTVKYKPYLIKPNQDELSEIFNVKIFSRARSN